MSALELVTTVFHERRLRRRDAPGVPHGPAIVIVDGDLIRALRLPRAVCCSSQENRGLVTSMPSGFFRCSTRRLVGASGPAAAVAATIPRTRVSFAMRMRALCHNAHHAKHHLLHCENGGVEIKGIPARRRPND